MDEKNLLYEVIKRFSGVDLSVERVDNMQMGYVFEELIRIGAEQSNEEAGEHFTPREVIKLMVNLLLAPEQDLRKSHIVKTLYDPACGTGGMLSVAEQYIRDLNDEARPFLFGQDYNDEAWAVCKSDMLVKGEDADNIRLGDTFTQDAFEYDAQDRKHTFDYMLANPPFGVEWKQQHIKREAATLGDKIGDITRIFGNFQDGETYAFPEEDPIIKEPVERERIVSKVFDNEDFGFHKITVERPLRLNFQASLERIARLESEPAFVKLAISSKKDEAVRRREIEAGKKRQKEIRQLLAEFAAAHGERLYKQREAFVDDLRWRERAAGILLSTSERKAVLAALGERDETAEICRDRNGNPEPDPELRDTESVPLKEDIAEYFQREVLPHVPGAWIDESKTKVGYEIPLNRHFYCYEPPRSLDVIEKDIKQLESERDYARNRPCGTFWPFPCPPDGGRYRKNAASRSWQ